MTVHAFINTTLHKAIDIGLNHFLKKLMSEACLVPLLGEHCSGFTLTGLSLAPPTLPKSCDLVSGSLSSVDSLSHTFSVTAAAEGEENNSEKEMESLPL